MAQTPRALLALAGLLLTALLTRGAEVAPRFSQTLSATQLAETGLTQLDSDHVAALDAQVAADARLVTTPAFARLPRAFSERHTPTEKSASGLDRLDTAQLSRLDGLVAVRIRAQDARAFATTRYQPEKPQTPKAVGPEPEIHGSAYFTLGWQSGGGTLRAAGFDVTYWDPVRKFALTVGFDDVRTHDFHLSCDSDLYYDGYPFSAHTRDIGLGFEKQFCTP